MACKFIVLVYCHSTDNEKKPKKTLARESIPVEFVSEQQK